MIEAIRASFPARGLQAGRLYFDSFDYAPDARARQPVSAAKASR